MREPPRPAPERVHPIVTPIKSVKPINVGDWRNQRPVFSSGVAPCVSGCPAGEQVREYIALALQGKLAEAWYKIKEDNPIPAVMGRVCYHPCETVCNRVELDQAVAIHCLERGIGDYGLKQGLKIKAGAAKEEKVAVIGSGPAGLSAAYHLARKGYGVSVYDAGAKPGGMLRYGIPAYRLPKDVLEAEVEGVAALGVEFVCGARIGENVPWDKLRHYSGVVVSAGCSVGRKLAIAGSDQTGILDGLSFLNAVDSEGVAQSCRGANVLVIGGGNVAIDVGRVAKRLGASKVTLAFLESLEAMPAHAQERDEARAEGVVFAPSRHFLEFQNRNGRLSGVRCERINSFELDRQSNLVVDAVPGSEHILEADTIVVAIGQRAELGFLPPQVQKVWSAVASGEAALSDRQWIVAAGDIVDGPSSVAKAIGGGKRAAAQLEALLQGRSASTDKERATPVGIESLNKAYFSRIEREAPPSAAPGARISGFDEVVGELSAEAFLAEAQRCFHCGDCNVCGNCWVFCPEAAIQKAQDSERADGLERFQVDYQTCKGCGICKRECPRGAIVMQEEFQ
ncbi:MAG: NAD(P)-binding protein [Pseudomonadota bacterium]